MVSAPWSFAGGTVREEIPPEPTNMYHLGIVENFREVFFPRSERHDASMSPEGNGAIHYSQPASRKKSRKAKAGKEA